MVLARGGCHRCRRLFDDCHTLNLASQLPSAGPERIEARVDAAKCCWLDLVTICRVKSQVTETSHAAVRGEKVLQPGKVAQTNLVKVGSNPSAPMALAVRFEKCSQLLKNHTQKFRLGSDGTRSRSAQRTRFQLRRPSEREGGVCCKPELGSVTTVWLAMTPTCSDRSQRTT